MAQDAKKPADAAAGADGADKKNEKKKMTKAEKQKEEEMVRALRASARTRDSARNARAPPAAARGRAARGAHRRLTTRGRCGCAEPGGHRAPRQACPHGRARKGRGRGRCEGRAGQHEVRGGEASDRASRSTAPAVLSARARGECADPLSVCRDEIREATSSMTSVPKPLKFLRPHCEGMKEFFQDMMDSDLKIAFSEVLSVLGMTMAG